MAQSTVLGNVYGKGSLLIWRFSNINEDMWHWRAAVRWFSLLAAAQALGQEKKKPDLPLFGSLCLCVLPCCTSSGTSTGNPGHPQLLQNWELLPGNGFHAVCCLFKAQGVRSGVGLLLPSREKQQEQTPYLLQPECTALISQWSTPRQSCRDTRIPLSLSPLCWNGYMGIQTCTEPGAGGWVITLGVWWVKTGCL